MNSLRSASVNYKRSPDNSPLTKPDYMSTPMLSIQNEDANSALEKSLARVKCGLKLFTINEKRFHKQAKTPPTVEDLFTHWKLRDWLMCKGDIQDSPAGYPSQMLGLP